MGDGYEDTDKVDIRKSVVKVVSPNSIIATCRFFFSKKNHMVLESYSLFNHAEQAIFG